jgi:hypothetical protein
VVNAQVTDCVRPDTGPNIDAALDLKRVVDYEEGFKYASTERRDGGQSMLVEKRLDFVVELS